MDYREREERRNGEGDGSKQSKPGFMSTANTDNSSTMQSSRGRCKRDVRKEKEKINKKQTNIVLDKYFETKIRMSYIA